MDNENIIKKIGKIFIIIIVILIIIGPIKTIVNNIFTANTAATASAEGKDSKEVYPTKKQCFHIYSSREEALKNGPNFQVLPKKSFDFHTPLSTLVIIDKAGKYVGRIGESVKITDDFKSNHSQFYVYYENYDHRTEEIFCITYR